ncbi:MAG: HAD-IIIC family phosphatase [Caulobacteraceae bacterium]|nr:HAD-IIIC family phosphatase [Caulobacteraceae bacterium]
MLTREQVFQGYQLLLGRLPENEDVIAHHRTHADIGAFVQCVMGSNEFLHPPAREAEPPLHPPPLEAPVRRLTQLGPLFQVPDDLRIGPPRPYRALLIGQCLFDIWRPVVQTLAPESVLDRVLINNFAVLPSAPPRPLAEYDFQLIQAPLRAVLPEGDYLRLGHGDITDHQRLFDEAVTRLKMLLDNALGWSDRLPAFVMNYLPPQQNLLGRLLPRYDLRNPVYFVEKLNEAIADHLSLYPNSYLLDANQVASGFGRRFMQDDIVCSYNHGGLLSDYDFPFDNERLIATARLSEHYAVDVHGFIETLWTEATAMFDTLRGERAVKMICVDLDDTLWRGVLAEREAVESHIIEGWPLGVMEALAYLKKRGVILAVVSKNDEALIRERWGWVFGARFGLDDFAIRKINWRPKAENIAEAMRDANILPGNVIFLDDNPAERAAVKAALPEVRVIEAPHYYWKRILLWSPETQVATITAESGRRTEMIQAQIQREETRTHLSKEAFLASLDLKVSLHQTDDVDDSRFRRAFELLNKTNQFNTTGERWTHPAADAYFAAGGVWWSFDVADRFTQYGLVGVVAVRPGVIDQVVMSCRVVGLDVETAVLAALQARLGPQSSLRATVRETVANRLARDLFERCGWRRDGEDWISAPGLAVPSHVLLD